MSNNCKYCGNNIVDNGRSKKYCDAKHKREYEQFKKSFIKNNLAKFSEIQLLNEGQNFTFDFIEKQWREGFDAEMDQMNDSGAKINDEIRETTSNQVLENLITDINFYSRSKKNPTSSPIEKSTNYLSGDQEIMAAYPVLTPSVASKIAEQVDEYLSFPKLLTPEIKYTLERYEGRGNVFDTSKQPDSAILHQFYTPYIICKKMIDLAFHHGFSGGTILEPSCGTGRFFKFAPEGTKLVGFDTEKTNIDIAKLLYPKATFYQQAFETAFLTPPNFTKRQKKSWIEPVDLVIGNPPYGEYSGYYKSYMPKVYNRFEFLFIRLGLELLKPGGLLIFLISNNLMNNGSKYNPMKTDILEIGEFVDAFRMPNKIFTGTAVGTDIVIFRKK